MICSFYIIINQYGFSKATKSKGTVRAGELQIQVNFKIPNQAFETPIFKANLDIKEEDLPNLVQEFELKLLDIKKGTELEEL